MEETTRNDPATCWEGNAETWTRQSRAGKDIYRDALNTPAFLAILPPVGGLRGLDVGCGEGTNTRAVAGRGAAMTGVDISPTFVRHAALRENADPMGIRYLEGNALALPFRDQEFDFVVAFMSMMDVGDPLRGMREAARVLRPGGFFQFSILHPCFAPPSRRVNRDPDGRVTGITVARYFDTGPHVETWSFSTLTDEEKRETTPFRVPYTHLTLAEWLNGLAAAGLRFDRAGEPSASEEVARAVPIVDDTRVAPLFLHLRAVKPQC